MKTLQPEAALRSMVARLQLGETERVKRLTPSLAAGVLKTGCRVLVCRRVARGEYVLLFSSCGLPKGQALKVKNAGYVIN
jgi:hypothetical protein